MAVVCRKNPLALVNLVLLTMGTIIYTPIAPIQTSNGLPSSLFRIAGGFEHNGLRLHHRRISISWIGRVKKPANGIVSRAVKDDQDLGDEGDILGGNSGIVSACFVGLLTGLCVVLFNNVV